MKVNKYNSKLTREREREEIAKKMKLKLRTQFGEKVQQKRFQNIQNKKCLKQK